MRVKKFCFGITENFGKWLIKELNMKRINDENSEEMWVIQDDFD